MPPLGRALFIIVIENGRAHVKRGQPPPGFVSACDDVARLHRVSRGRIWCVRRAGRQALCFSRDIPERLHQPFRNVWTPPPTRGPNGRRARG